MDTRQCKGTTKGGAACKRPPSKDRPYCLAHDPERVDEHAAISKHGGHMRHDTEALSIKDEVGIYDADYESVEPLMSIAAEHNVCILVVHHDNKREDPEDPFDAISQSTGLTGGVDGVLILRRERGKADAFLYVDGRDVPEQGELPLKWDHNVCSWTLADGKPIEYRMGDERKTIYDALPDHGEQGIGPKQVEKKTGMKGENVRYLLGQMVKDKHAKNTAYGKYTKYPLQSSRPSQSPPSLEGVSGVRDVSDVHGDYETETRSSTEKPIRTAYGEMDTEELPF